jgi:hypothetical protein
MVLRLIICGCSSAENGDDVGGGDHDDDDCDVMTTADTPRFSSPP